MSILEAGMDKWDNTMYGLPCGLYFYYMNSNLPGWTFQETSIIGNCPAIQTVQYVPFIEEEDLGLFKIPYDIERFGDTTRPGLTSPPNVYRIANEIKTNKIKTLGSFKCYKPQKNIGGEISWKNESRLYNYPYSFAMITDHLNPPIEVKYHLVPGNIANVKVRNTISDRCSYALFIEGYKGDTSGKMEAMVSGDAHELPCSSSAYNQWFASNKNQTAQDVKSVMQNSFLTKQTNSKMLLPNLVGNFAGTTLNPMSWLGSGANLAGDLINYNQNNKRADLDVQQAIQSKIAQSQDLMSTPNTMVSMGSDVYYGLDSGGKKVSLYRFGLHIEQLKKLGDYFAMFGYKQNKILKPNIRNRYYFNYIKTVGANLKSINIPRDHFEKLKGIFDNGVTIWHIDREGVEVGNISKDNYEI